VLTGDRRDTQASSLDAYEGIAPSLEQREQGVLLGLQRCIAWHQRNPTSYELLEFMKSQHIGGVKDVNSVRPRLTSLKEKRRVVVDDHKRRCTITGKMANTWRLADGKLF
jgi:hypothetical protein